MSATEARVLQELLLERHFAAAPELLLEAWVDGREKAQWFGPEGFSCPRCEIEPRPGGKVDLVLQSPDGELHDCGGSVIEYVQPARLFFETRIPDGSEPPNFMMDQILDLAPTAAGTQVAWLTQVVSSIPGAELNLDMRRHELVSRRILDRLNDFLHDQAAGRAGSPRVLPD